MALDKVYVHKNNKTLSVRHECFCLIYLFIYLFIYFTTKLEVSSPSLNAVFSKSPLSQIICPPLF